MRKNLFFKLFLTLFILLSLKQGAFAAEKTLSELGENIQKLEVQNEELDQKWEIFKSQT